MKKKLSLLLSLVLLFTILPFNLVNAENFGDETIIVNEYKALKKLNKELEEFEKSKGDIKPLLEIEGYSEKDLYIIKNYKEVYKNKIENLKNKDIDALKYLGYEEDQIDAIKNFDGSEEMIMRSSSRLSLTTGIRNHEYNSRYDETTAQLNIDFRWLGSPTYEFKDILAIVWSDDYIVDTRRSLLEVEYINEHYREEESESYDIEYKGLNKAHFEFPKQISKRISGGVRGYSISRGGGVIYFSDIERISRIRTYSAYGYNTLRFNPNFSIDSSGTYGLGISFSWGVDELDNDFQYNYLK